MAVGRGGSKKITSLKGNFKIENIWDINIPHAGTFITAKLNSKTGFR